MNIYHLLIPFCTYIFLAVKHSPSKKRGQAGQYGQSSRQADSSGANRPRSQTEPVLSEPHSKKTLPTEETGIL